LKEGVGIALIDPNTDSSLIYMSETGKKAWKIMQEYLATQLT
jgi:hypothetical protein